MRQRQLLAAGLGFVLLGCRTHPAPELLPDAIVTAPASAVVSCARRSAVRQEPLESSGTSSVALARSAGRTLAYIADEESATLRTIDVDIASEIATTPLFGAPTAVLVLRDGRIVVSLRDRAELAVLEPANDFAKPLEKRCSVDVATEPTGLATSPDGTRVFVASRWGHALTAFGSEEMALRFTVDLPRDPRAVVTSSDGKKVFVAHVAGSRISVVDVEGDHHVRSIDLHDRQRREIRGLSMHRGIDRDASLRIPGSSEDKSREFGVLPLIRVEQRDQHADQGYSLVRTAEGTVLAPEAMVDTGNGVRSGGYGEARSAFGDIAAISEKTERRLVRPPLNGPTDDCLLPRAAALDMQSNKLVVACLGLDAVVAYDAKSPAPHGRELRRYSIASGPSGIAVDDGHRAVVWSAFDKRVTIIDLQRLKGDSDKIISVEETGSNTTADIERGRILFHVTGGGRIAFDGRACASCHPDGRDDALTWTTPEGPRQTPLLANRLSGTAPYGWSGANPSLSAHMKDTFDRLAGKGITPKEQDQLFAYIATLTTPGSIPAPEQPTMVASASKTTGNPEVNAKAARGEAIFDSAEAGCSSCHLGGALTDGVRHDVKSRGAGDAKNAFDTPSLRFIANSAPYYHDGRYATLGDLLRASNGKMGHTANLSAEQKEELTAYLNTL